MFEMYNTTKYNKDQVFISFRGKDKRNGFLSHLRQKLIDGNVNVFTDDDLVGQPLENLFRHIRNSRIVIVIFSENYADSNWCLEELVEIKKCIETEKVNGVIPIFHIVEVSSVKELKGKFGDSFRAYQNSLRAKQGITDDELKEVDSKINKWKKALKVVTGISGLYYDGKSSEAAFLEKVVEIVNKILAKTEAEEGHNTMNKGKQQSNQIVFNVNQMNINSQLYYSTTLEALNPEGYNMSVDLKHMSFDHRRTNSDLDHRDQYGPFPFEAILVGKQFKNSIVPVPFKAPLKKWWHDLACVFCFGIVDR